MRLHTFSLHIYWVCPSRDTPSASVKHTRIYAKQVSAGRFSKRAVRTEPLTPTHSIPVSLIRSLILCYAHSLTSLSLLLLSHTASYIHTYIHIYIHTGIEIPDLERLSIVAMAGVAGEALYYEEVKGQTADLTDLQRMINRAAKPLRANEQMELTRWALFAAAKMINTYRDQYEALVEAMKEKKDVVGCFDAIESTPMSMST